MTHDSNYLFEGHYSHVVFHSHCEVFTDVVNKGMKDRIFFIIIVNTPELDEDQITFYIKLIQITTQFEKIQIFFLATAHTLFILLLHASDSKSYEKSQMENKRK